MLTEDRRDAPAGAFVTRLDPATGVAEVRMCGTGAGNAMGALVWAELPRVVQALAADDQVRAVVLRGEADCFSVGLDLRWYLTHYRRLVRAGDELGLRQRLLAEAEQMQQAINAVATTRLPVIAAVHGACVGAGLDLAAACDIRLASADAYFSLREVRIGVVADLGSLQRLPRLIGAGPTRELALTGRDLPADEAYRHGLVSAVLPAATELFARASALAAQIAGYPCHVVAGIKDVLDRTQDLPVSAGLRYVNVFNAAFLPSPHLPDLLARALRNGVEPGAGECA
ncbi:MAG TPA: enoyl-CoA hydratase-related protein [Micromonosporaceae bacterium]